MRATASDAAGWTRRAWLSAAILGGAGLALRRPAVGAEEAGEADEAEVERVREHARKAGLGPIGGSVNEHYLGVGDAPEAFRKEALGLCLKLATEYRKHFQAKGFAVAFPARRLTVVVLKDRMSYAAYLGQNAGDAVGGHYDLDTNRLVMFDFRPGGGLPAGVDLARVNTFTLIHEATHQLTFNTGMLERQGDVPFALSEGLAMYAELWRPDGRSVLGAIDRPRLQVLVDQAKQPQNWIPLKKLLTEDDIFQQVKTEQLAYAGAWVLVYHLLKTPAMLPKFRAYLDAIRPRRDPSRRLDDASDYLGNLDRLDLELRKGARRRIQGLP